MVEVSAVFPVEEYQRRLLRFQEQMHLNRLDAMMLTSPADVFYSTGFLTRFWESPARPWFVLVLASGSVIAVIPSIGAELMGCSWVRDIRTWDAPHPTDDGVTLLSETLCETLPEHARIGVPMGLETHLRMPLADYARVSHAIAPRVFVDGTTALQRVREIKSPAEIARIQISCEIAHRAFSTVASIAQPGRPLSDIFRDFQVQLLQEGADWVSYLAGGAGPNGYSDVISPPSNTPLAKGDILMLDTGAVSNGYFCDFDRNFSVGPASDRAKTVHAALWQATDTALSTIRPGMRACDVHQIMAQSLVDQGQVPVTGRFGHGLGVTLTEWPSFTPLDQTELREGMVLTLEPGAIVTPGRILVHEENIVLRADGAELLSPRAPSELPEIPL